MQNLQELISLRTFFEKDIFLYIFDTDNHDLLPYFQEIKNLYPERIKKIKNEKHLIEFLAVRWFHHIYLGINDRIYISENKEPYCSGIPSISISHSHGKVAMAYSPKQKIGIDIEKTNNKIELVKHKILFPTELDLESKRTETGDRKDYFMRIWTGKEAAYKASDSNKFSFKNYETVDLQSQNPACIIHEYKEFFKLYFLEKDLYYFCLAIKQ
jgi:4'-phosphopantetheinyl transferase EntD